METGYQKLLHYLHDDGSFSSFGPGFLDIDETKVPINGSTWLTAYVLQSLMQGSKYSKVDTKIFDNGFKYLASQQAANGSFTEKGEYFYSAQKANIVLTSKVLLAFMENEVKCLLNSLILLLIYLTILLCSLRPMLFNIRLLLKKL